jgi:hypothetical protein
VKDHHPEAFGSAVRKVTLSYSLVVRHECPQDFSGGGGIALDFIEGIWGITLK